MDEFEFDRTRKAIGVHKLEEEEKKKLLQKFQEKGGKILQERAVKKEDTNRYVYTEKTSGQQRRETGFLERERDFRESKTQDRITEKIDEKTKKEELLKKASSPLAIFFLKLQLWLKGIIHFQSEIIKPSYMSFLNLEFKKAILETNILATELLSDPKFLEEFKKKFQPFLLEILKRMYLIYDRKQLSELTADYTETGNGVKVEEIREPLFYFLRRIYIFHRFREFTLRALFSFIDLQESLQKKQKEIYNNKRRRIEEAWSILMDKALPNFILLAQLAERKRLEPFTPLFEEMIGLPFTEHLDPSKFRTYQDVDLTSLKSVVNQQQESSPADTVESGEPAQNTEQTDQQQQQEVQQEKPQDPKELIHQKIYQYGLRFLLYYPVPQLRKMYDPKDEFKEIPVYDKIFLSYLFLNFFDEQFGFIFLTNKIKIATFFKDGVKSNLKEEMSSIYENYRSIERSFRKYYADYMTYLSTKNDPYANRNSIDYQKLLDFQTKKRVQSALETHKIMLSYIRKITQILLTLYRDTKESNHYILNPDDIIQLEYDEKKNKLMNMKKVRDVIRDAYATAYTLTYKMENGELYVGELEMSEEEFKHHYEKIL